MTDFMNRIKRLHRVLRDNKAYYKYMRNFQNLSPTEDSADNYRKVTYKKANGNIMRYFTMLYTDKFHSYFTPLHLSFILEDTIEGKTYWEIITRSYYSYNVFSNGMNERINTTSARAIGQ